MFTRIIQFITDTYRMSLVSLGGAGAGTITADSAEIINMAQNTTAEIFQYTAWSVAIMAGVIAIINGSIDRKSVV